MFEELALQGLVTALVALPTVVAGMKVSMNGIKGRQETQSRKMDSIEEKLDTHGERLACLEAKVDIALGVPKIKV